MEAPKIVTNVEESIEENSQFTSKRKSSYVWEHMEKLQVKPGEKAMAQCKYCKSKLGCDPFKGTSHMRRHLESCLKRPKFGDIKQCMAANHTGTDGSVILKNYKFSQLNAKTALSVFLVMSKLPFMIVENQGFRHFCSAMNPQFKHVSRHTATRSFLEYFEKEKVLVKDALGAVKGHICLTSDTWKSEHTLDEYCYITAHWLDASLKLQKRVIQFKDLVPPFDEISLCDSVSNCLARWEISDKIFTLTMDNASYNDVLATELKKRLSNFSPLICNGQFFYVHCSCHIINLIVQAGLKCVDDILSKVQHSVKFIKKSGPRKHKFYDLASKNYHLNTSRKLRIDCTVRWNSTFLMLGNFLYYKEVWYQWAHRDRSFLYGLSEEEWKQIGELHEFLKVFYDVTNDLSSTQNNTSNIYFKGVFQIQVTLMNALDSCSSFMLSMITGMQTKFNKYWSDYNVLLACAVVLDPRYKVKLVDYCYMKLYGSEEGPKRTKEVVDMLYSLFAHYYDSKRNTSTVVPRTLNIVMSSFRGVGFEDYYSYETHGVGAAEKNQMDQYLEEVYHSEMDALEYLRLSKTRHPDVVAIARDILAIPISSVPSESVFSIGKKVISPYRSSLKPKTVQALMCCGDWMRAKNLSGEETSSIVIDDPSSSSEDDNHNSDDDLPL